MAAVDDILQRVPELPALPSSSARIISMLTEDGDNANVAGIAEVVRQDEAVAMTVLRYANSAQYGAAGREFDLEASIVRLGAKMLMKIALAQQSGEVFGDAGARYGLRRGALWRGAVGGAIAAEEIARSAGHPEPELCFLCGLVRDVGKLVLDAYLLADGKQELDVLIPPGGTFLEAERDSFGADHTEVGAALARHWRLPELVVNAIRLHHKPPGSDAEHDQLYCIVHAADIICLWAGLAVGHDGLHYELCSHVRKTLLTNRSRVEELMAFTWNKLRELELESNEPCPRDKSA